MSQSIMYALLSVFFLILSAVLGWGLITQAEVLARHGLLGRFYFIPLCALGLSVAIMLFAVLKSTGYAQGELFGLNVEFSGPAAGFLLVLLFGYYQRPDPVAFSATIFVHGPGGAQDAVLKNEGMVWLDVGGDRRVEPIGAKGQAVFNEIPASFRDAEVSLGLQHHRWQPLSNNAPLKLKAGSLYLPIIPIKLLLRGTVTDGQGTPLVGARVAFGRHFDQTNRDGWFELSVPADDGVDKIQVTKPGFQTWRGTATPGANTMEIRLKKA